MQLLMGWAGLAFGLMSIALAVMSRREAIRERRRTERLTLTLSRSHRPTALGQPVTTEERELRSVLISVAAGEQPFAVALKQTKPLGVPASVVHELAEQLRQTGLLEFAPPLAPQTRLFLSK